MYVYCSCGQEHWGRYGAAGLLLTNPDATTLLLQKRSAVVHQGGTWALIGGALERGETPEQAALREAEEEEGIPSSAITVIGTLPGLVHPEWTYTYVRATMPGNVPSSFGWGWESDGVQWFGLDDVAALPLHPALRDAWPALRWTLGER